MSKVLSLTYCWCRRDVLAGLVSAVDILPLYNRHLEIGNINFNKIDSSLTHIVTGTSHTRVMTPITTFLVVQLYIEHGTDDVFDEVLPRYCHRFHVAHLVSLLNWVPSFTCQWFFCICLLHDCPVHLSECGLKSRGQLRLGPVSFGQVYQLMFLSSETRWK